jgi:hypothetical protein
MFMVPALTPGEYSLVVRVIKNTTNVREGKLDTPLTVV